MKESKIDVPSRIMSDSACLSARIRFSKVTGRLAFDFLEAIHGPHNGLYKLLKSCWRIKV